jgi:indole-3-glycerol phosphate synthase
MEKTGGLMREDFLSNIITRKKQEVETAKRNIPENTLRREAAGIENRRPFFETLKNKGPHGINIIAEIKRASPSKGPIRPELDPALYAAAYEQGGAAAISVLTDDTFFMGTLDDLKRARSATGLPVLRKDFIISEYQIYESVAIGADAILLIARCLSKEQLNEFTHICRELKLDTLVEIHSEADLEIATNSGAKLIGINNRNLKTFETDINIAMHLTSLLHSDQVPVAASGISRPEDIEKNLKFGIYNFLIGESIVRATSPKVFLRQLLSCGQI